MKSPDQHSGIDYFEHAELVPDNVIKVLNRYQNILSLRITNN